MNSTDASGNEVKTGGRRRRNNMTMRKRRNNMTMRRNNMYGGSDDAVMDASGNEMMSGGRRRRNNMTMRKNNNMMGGKMPAVGTKAQVWHGTAKHTSGGLTKKDLMKTKKGRIVSKKKHAAGQRAIKQLKKAGYVAKKGTFKLFKKQ